MAFWDKWFSSPVEDSKPVKSLDYKGFLIEATPYKEGREYQLAGVISKDGKTLTQTFKGVDAQGKPVTSKSVFDKQ